MANLAGDALQIHTFGPDCNNAGVNGSLDLTPWKAEALVTEALEDTKVSR